MPANLPSQGRFSVNGRRAGTNYFTVDGVAADFGLLFATAPWEGGGAPSLSSQGSTAALASVAAAEEFTARPSPTRPRTGAGPALRRPS